MTLVTSSVESEIHDLHQRHSSIRQKWLDKQRHINEILASAIEICRANEEDIKSSEVRLDPSEIHLNQDFQETLINYIRKHHSVSVKQLTHIFDKDEREVRDIFKSFLRRHLIKYDNEDQTIVSSVEDSPSPQPKIGASPIKRGIPSWMGLPTRRGTLIPRDRPPRDLLHLLSSPTARELEREKLNVELDHLLNRQTAMEKIRARRFHTNDSIQEYCQYTTRDECPYANPHSSYFRARSSSTSSDDQHSMHNDESQSRKKRKRDESESNDGKDSNRRSSSHYYRKNSRSQSTCGKVHFRRLIKPHTDINLGDCSFLNTCFHMETCKYIHYQIDKTDFIPSNSTNERNVTGKSNRHLPIVQRITPNAVPAQWVQCDLRQFDMSVLGKFSVIMADPPWDIHMELPYGTMADDEMRQLNIPSLQDDGYIFLWVTGRAMELGRECLRIWGYQRCDEVIWVKTNQLQRIIRTGRTGHWLNHGKEHCLVGVKGSPKGNHRGLDSDVIVAEVRATSRKPDEIYGIIERLLPGTRKVELFGRPHNVQPNWITLGNQLDGVRLVEPDVVRRYRQRYPDGYRMSSSGQPQAPSSSSATANDTKPTMSNAALTSK